MTLALIAKGHCLDPAQIAMAQPLSIARRLFTSPAAPQILARAKACWNIVKDRARHVVNDRALKGGLICRLKATVEDLGRKWPASDHMIRPSGQLAYLIKHPNCWLQRALREDLRR